MYRTLAFLSKRADISTADFIDYYENHHVPLINSLCGPENMPLVYKRRYTHRDDPSRIRVRASKTSDGVILPGGQGECLDFDVVTEIAFADQAASRRWIEAISKGGNAQKVADDEEKFLDRARTKAVIVDEFVTCG